MDAVLWAGWVWSHVQSSTALCRLQWDTAGRVGRVGLQGSEDQAPSQSDTPVYRLTGQGKARCLREGDLSTTQWFMAHKALACWIFMTILYFLCS